MIDLGNILRIVCNEYHTFSSAAQSLLKSELVAIVICNDITDACSGICIEEGIILGKSANLGKRIIFNHLSNRMIDLKTCR